ncbi:uncharacterized protein LOC132169680 [Corylus avellana]|uniref:uncharacterized protein LOC132169680 n=1 Tax=Corylus avellana TaxID=13451 RepID=UPI00286BB849|nr:uncharacterized protein LOC132169680 [Corylus avellana]
MRYPFPDKYKVPRVDKYDGSGDPTEHMESFLAHLILHGTPVEIACCAFPLTLKGVAKDWFGGLDPKKNESLKDYLLRFNREKLMVEKVSDETVLLVLMNGIKAEGPLMAELAQKKKWEEIVGALLKSKTEVALIKPNSGKAPESSKKKRKEEKAPPRSLQRKVEPQHQQGYKYTPLNASITKVFMEIKSDPTFKWPTKMRTPSFKNGKLVRFLARERSRGRDPQELLQQSGNEALERRQDDRVVRPRHNDEPRMARAYHHNPQNQDVIGEIHMISGGVSWWRRGRVAMPHEDALVVTITVANHAIHQILVDSRSSADILYWLVFKQMGIDQDRIKPFGSPLVGFTGEQVQPMGLISLPTIAGIALKQVTIMVDFLVIDLPSAYNAIIDRPSLDKLRAITSTCHLKMKFPLEEGVGEVKGDQVVARNCYNTSMKKFSESAPFTIGNVTSRKEGEPAEDLVNVSVGEDKVVKVGSQLTPQVRKASSTFFRITFSVCLDS